MTTKQRLTLWVLVATFSMANVIHGDALTAAFIWALAVCIELQSERAELELRRREWAEDLTRHYVARLYGVRPKRRAKVIEISNRNGNEAA